MKRTVWQQDAPEAWEDRLCVGFPTSVFFPDHNQADAALAVSVCEACPVLARCAKWAQSAGLTDCIVAGVHMPTYGPSHDHAIEQLRVVAATGAIPAVADLLEGGAAWTAA
ncbi:WhiB family transcriptional regulator [Nocardia sp. CA-120079]|uniref:WhiB family transcriptional regulator n=1 Tax=Nocardia sp. CA-120079 TaxID=3239974 RepID=UPI003D97CA04